MRGGVTVRAQDLKTRLPEDMFGEIREMHPLLTPKLTNATIGAVAAGGAARKEHIIHLHTPLRSTCERGKLSGVPNERRATEEKQERLR